MLQALRDSCCVIREDHAARITEIRPLNLELGKCYAKSI